MDWASPPRTDHLPMGKIGPCSDNQAYGAVQGGLGRSLRERYPRLRSDLPVGNVTFELELEGHRQGQNGQCGQREENEWRLRNLGSWVGKEQGRRSWGGILREESGHG